MKRIALLLMLVPCIAFGQNNVQEYIDGVMKKNPRFINSVTAILAVDPDGKEIASWNADMPVLTASTMKTITTGVALNVLGSDYRFETKIGYVGEITENGVLRGDIYIIGGADPSLASRDTIGYPIDSIFGIWTKAIKDEGIKMVDGRIIADDRFFSDDIIPDSWSWGNFGPDYGSGTCGLSFAENLSYFELAPGAVEGDPVRITPLEAFFPGMTFVNNTVTGKAGIGDRTEYFTSDLAPVGQFDGQYGIDRRIDTVALSNKFPQWTCAYEFMNYLAENAIHAADITTVGMMARMGEHVPSVEEMKVIATTYSPELITLVNVTNRISNNFFAETFLRMIGKTLADDSGYRASAVALKKFVEEHGCSVTGLTQEDGSGLSRQNYVSPRFFCNFYKMMEGTPVFEDYFNSFPGPGRPGTLKNVLSKEKWELKSCIHAKSGSLSNVRCYAGYAETSAGLIRFAILCNNYEGSTSNVQPGIEGFMKELAVYAHNYGKSTKKSK